MGPGLAPQARSSTAGSFALVLCWDVLELAAVVAERPAHAWQSRAGAFKTYSTTRPTTRAEAPVQPGPIGTVGFTRLVDGEIKQYRTHHPN